MPALRKCWMLIQRIGAKKHSRIVLCVASYPCVRGLVLGYWQMAIVNVLIKSLVVLKKPLLANDFNWLYLIVSKGLPFSGNPIS